MQRSRIGSVAATAFLNYPPPSAKDDAHGRTTGGKRPNRSERHVWRSESQTCKPHKQVTLSALSNEGIENNRSHIDPSRCRSSLSFGSLRKIIAAMRYGYMECSIRTTGICNKGRNSWGAASRFVSYRIIGGSEQPRAGTHFARGMNASLLRAPRVSTCVSSTHEGINMPSALAPG